MKIVEIKSLPVQFDRLMIAAELEGHHFLRKMKDEWRDGKNRFAKNGEVLFSIVDATGELIGIGGLNIDPYANDPAVGRVRHVYVTSTFRGRGLGKSIVETLITHAREHFKILRLRTHNTLAVPFYVSLGFTVNSEISDPSHSYLQMQF